MASNIESLLNEIIGKIQSIYPEFEANEIKDLCLSYLSSFPKKTKFESLSKSLYKYINKEFNLEKDNMSHNNIKLSEFNLNNLPKYLFQTSKFNSDYCLLQINNLSKAIGLTSLFEDTHLQILGTDKIALLGKNGSGKSTLLKMILGMDEMDEGEIIKANNLSIGYLSQDLFWQNRDNIVQEELLDIFPDITHKYHRFLELINILNNSNSKNINTNITLLDEKNEIEAWLKEHDGYRKYALQTDLIKYFGFSANHLKLRIAQLSGGEQTKIQIIKFFLREVDLLILDEPTNHLDIEGILFLEQFCQLRQKGLICISHDKRFIERVFHKIVEISHKKINIYHGNYQFFLTKKQQNYDLQMKNYHDQQKELIRQEQFINRFRYQANKASQVQSRIKLINKIEKLEPPVNESNVKNIRSDINMRLPNIIMSLHHLIVGYQEALVKIDKIINITSNQKIGIIGKNGIGKTTLLKTILGEINPLAGNCTINPRIVVGSYSQTIEKLNISNTILEELLGPGVSQKDVRSKLGSLLITGEKVNQQIGTLSGGEQAKVALVKMLLTQPHMLIMDEPTNHLDLYSKEAIKNMLADFSGVTMIVSHDRDLLTTISNQIRVIKDKKLTIFDNIEKSYNYVIDQ